MESIIMPTIMVFLSSFLGLWYIVGNFILAFYIALFLAIFICITIIVRRK